MASAPRSSGTDSLDTFRTALSKNMPSPPGSAESDDALGTLDDDALREVLREALASGRPVEVRRLALWSGVPLDRVLRVLGLPADTSPEQTVVGRAERPARKGRAKS